MTSTRVLILTSTRSHISKRKTAGLIQPMIESNPHKAIFHGSIFYQFIPFRAKFRAWTDASERWEITAIMIQELSTASNGSYIKAGVLSDSRWPGVSILSIYHLSRPPHGRAVSPCKGSFIRDICQLNWIQIIYLFENNVFVFRSAR